MQKIIPVFYSEYGRYITKLRAIPYFIDCLKPVERRLLVSLYEKGRKKVKSAKILGHLIAKYHPHGTDAAYGTLVHLVDQNFAIGQGNWGSPGLEDAKSASFRYTECKISPWVVDLLFKYYKYVPWKEIELDSEPLYLPSPIPIGLVGDNIIQGISFHRTVIPKYKLKDLLKRCIHLEENGDERKNIIKPNIRGCLTQEIDDSYFKLLKNGEGSLKIIPNGNITNKYIEILGKNPFKTFSRLINQTSVDKKTKTKKYPVYIDDLSDDKINIRITPERPKKTNLNTLAQKIWNDCLISESSFTCLVCNDDGNIQQMGIDVLIRNSYYYWKLAVLKKKISNYNKINLKKFENSIIEIIRIIFEKHKSHKIDDIVNQYQIITKNQNHKIDVEYYDETQRKWLTTKAEITEQDIRNVCNKKSIQALIEHKLDLKKIDTDLLNIKNSINNNDIECLNDVKSMI